jgi:hypothetical protein
MLPYTTYHIPETNNSQTAQTPKWLWMVVPTDVSSENQEFLTKISAALKADFNQDVFFIKPDEHGLKSLGDIPGEKPKLIISFGILPENIGLWIDLAKPGMRVMEQYTFILTLTPEALNANAIAKKELWRWMQTYLESHPA